MYENLHFIHYARVSTKDQSDRGSYKIQVTNAKNFCSKNNIILTDEDIFVDKGKHGWILDSKEFKDMQEALKTKDGLLIEHTDRFFRGDPKDPTSMIDALNLYRAIFKSGKIVYSIQEKELKMDTLMDVLLLTVRTYTASERIIVDKAKQKDGIRKKIKETGKWGPNIKKLNVKQYTELREKGFDKTTCAKFLGISTVTLNRRLHELEINDFEKFKTKGYKKEIKN